MNVLSLFDGISCGQIALNRIGYTFDGKLNKYYASEIDKNAIKIAMKNYPNTIQIGDVINIDYKILETMPKIDLVLAGSPCQGFSSMGSGLNFEHPQSKLFFEFVRILNWIKENNNDKVKFLLENVKMKKEYLSIIDKYTGVSGLRINSNMMTAQNRERYYWTDINFDKNIQDANILIDDILETKKVDESHYCKEHQIEHFSKCNYVKCDFNSGTEIYDFYNKSIKFGKSNTVTPHCFRKDRSACNIIKDGYGIRRLTPIECERLQGIPDNYTYGIATGNRYKAIGNGWTIPIITHILKGLKEDKNDKN